MTEQKKTLTAKVGAYSSIVESAAARLIAMLLCEAAEIAKENERGKWLDAIGEYFDGPTAEAVRAYTEDRGTKMEIGQAGQSTSPA